MAIIDIKVPDIGDFDEVGVIEVLVKVGDTIRAEQSLVTVESDKASMEIPSSHAGVVKSLLVKVGDKVAEGSVVLTLETADAALTHNQLGGIAAMIRLSRAALANIHQNIALALGLKAIFLVTSLLGITGLWIAVLADTGATALVTANALRLLRKR